ncbi:hypothetical protein G3580_09740 [Nitrogeniibacter mangrovi]|uniref:Uncharacterized protein n=1 Tax=Nitrogeniibacter mangrovi TaxID=2016596 RepID=A0A6C1B2N1_9RHOO|nr:hypothetical protein [Nitrogeniibacter mangrovi]QID17896.1 hypothetical protein G3580_09740 [Nitrogeniibacter mangrovi]
MIASTEQRAGWLDIAAAPIWQGRQAKVCIHAVCLHDCTCHAISLNGRWVCSTDGSLSIFQTHESAEHFLELAHVSCYEDGEAAELAPECDAHMQCISFQQKSGLGPCRAACAESH